MCFMACTAHNDIPQSMLPVEGSKVQQEESIEMLKAYAFNTGRQSHKDSQHQRDRSQRPTKAFDLHPLVHLAMRGWMEASDQWKDWGDKVLTRLIEIVPYGDHDTRLIWIAYLPHARHIVELSGLCELGNMMSLFDRVGHCELTLGRYKAAGKPNGSF